VENVHTRLRLHYWNQDIKKHFPIMERFPSNLLDCKLASGRLVVVELSLLFSLRATCSTRPWPTVAPYHREHATFSLWQWCKAQKGERNKRVLHVLARAWPPSFPLSGRSHTVQFSFPINEEVGAPVLLHNVVVGTV
jgi:hypothetical protein